MDWTAGIIIVFISAAVTLGLFVLNLVIAVKQDGKDSLVVSVAMHVMGAVTLLLNLGRQLQTAPEALIIGHALACLFVFISLRRVFKRRKESQSSQ